MHVGRQHRHGRQGAPLALKHNSRWCESYASPLTDFRESGFICRLQLHKRSDRKNKVLTEASHYPRRGTPHWNCPYPPYFLVRSPFIRWCSDFPAFSDPFPPFPQRLFHLRHSAPTCLGCIFCLNTFASAGAMFQSYFRTTTDRWGCCEVLGKTRKWTGKGWKIITWSDKKAAY